MSDLTTRCRALIAHSREKGSSKFHHELQNMAEAILVRCETLESQLAAVKPTMSAQVPATTPAAPSRPAQQTPTAQEQEDTELSELLALAARVGLKGFEAKEAPANQAQTEDFEIEASAAAKPENAHATDEGADFDLSELTALAERIGLAGYESNDGAQP